MRDDPLFLMAGSQSPHEMVREYFTYDYQLANLTSTKQSVSIKIQNILGKGVLDRVLCGHTTINLERLLSQNKIVLFNLSKGLLGEDESSALGTLVVSLLQSIAQKRAEMPEAMRPVTHLIVDECQNFTTTAMIPIIEEARKFGLPMTLAQLSVGRGMSAELKKVVTSTTNVKVAGPSDEGETTASGRLVKVDGKEISDLTQKGAFYYKNGSAPPFLLHARADRLKDNGGVPSALWAKIIEQQKSLFYRDPTITHDPDPEFDSPPPETEPPPHSYAKSKRKFV